MLIMYILKKQQKNKKQKKVILLSCTSVGSRVRYFYFLIIVFNLVFIYFGILGTILVTHSDADVTPEFQAVSILFYGWLDPLGSTQRERKKKTK